MIIYTFPRYGRRELPGFVSRPMFIAWCMLLLPRPTSCIGCSLWSSAGWLRRQYAVFLQNLLMSGLFIAMFVALEVRAVRASSSYCNCGLVPSLPPSRSAPWQDQRSFSAWASLCSVFDLAYLGLLLWAARTCRYSIRGSEQGSRQK